MSEPRNTNRLTGIGTTLFPLVGSGAFASGAVLSGDIGSGQIGHFHIASGQLTGTELGSGAIVSGRIASGQVGFGHLADGSVQSGTLASGQISRFAVASGSFLGFELGSGAIVSGRIASGQVGFGHLANAAVLSGTLASGIVAQFHLASGAVNSGHINATGTPDNTTFLRGDFTWAGVTATVNSGQIGSGAIASGAVQGFFGTTRHVASGTLGAFDFGSGAVVVGTVGSGAVVSGNIASGQIGVGHLATDAVTNSAIASGAVTSGEIASGQIGPRHLADSSVQNSTIGSGAVTSGKIASGQIGFGHLADGSVQSGTLASGQISRFAVASGSFLGFELGSGSIVSGRIASGQVGFGHLADASVQNSTIGSGAVTSGKIASGQVGFRHLANASVQSGTLASGQVSTYTLSSGATTTNSQFTAPFVSGTTWTAVTEENISGVRAVTLSLSGYLRIAKTSLSGQMAAIGIVVDNVASGIVANVFSHGVFQFTSGMADYSGYLGRALYVGRSGQIVTLSGSFNSGGLGTSGTRQVIGTVWNSGGAVISIAATDEDTYPLTLGPGGYSAGNGLIMDRGILEVEFTNQSSMETGSSTSTVVNPFSMKWHQGVAKAWCRFSASGGTVSLKASYNVSSVTRLTTGKYRVNWETGFSSDNYTVIPVAGGLISGVDNLAFVETISPFSGNSVTLAAVDSTIMNATDPREIHIAAFGDL